ncbi:RNA polymerase sigma factor [Vallitalea okinawensis]|uniref:RNA polymerase sigma factor n=1 Tax=Vallitalea okinawensis TaxID=2078660 RepID=UPI002E8DE2B6|nr:sigma-70 family RNA polymerase sigma factor [Vallitalea okinawensis]
MLETELLIKRAKQGDKEALLKLIMDQEQDYYRLAYTYMRNEDDALDALEDMIVIIYEKIQSLKKEKSFYSWSKTILVNRCKKLLKDKKKIVSMDFIEERACLGGLEGKEETMLIEEHLTKLNKKHQEVIRLHYYLDYDYQTISQLLHIPLGTVKSRMSIGIKKLKESLGGGFHE